MLEKKCPTCGCVMHTFTEKDKAQMGAAFAKITALEKARRAVLDAAKKWLIGECGNSETCLDLVCALEDAVQALLDLEKDRSAIMGN